MRNIIFYEFLFKFVKANRCCYGDIKTLSEAIHRYSQSFICKIENLFRYALPFRPKGEGDRLRNIKVGEECGVFLWRDTDDFVSLLLDIFNGIDMSGVFYDFYPSVGTFGEV